jgi:hypothetical protein
MILFILILWSYLVDSLKLAEFPVKRAGPAYLQACSHPSTFCPASRSSHHLHVLLNKVPHHLAPCACAFHGMKLASITDQNFLAAGELIKECLGIYEHVWIHSWNGDNYEGIALAMFIGGGINGAVAVPRHNDNEAQVLCEEHH